MSGMTRTVAALREAAETLTRTADRVEQNTGSLMPAQYRALIAADLRQKADDIRQVVERLP